MTGSTEDLPRVAPAMVRNAAGTRFSAAVSNVLPNSLLLKHLPIPLVFREKVVVDLFGYSVDGEVVFAADQEAGIVFETTPDIFSAIEAFEDFVNVTASVPDGPDPLATVDLPTRVDRLDDLPEVDVNGGVVVRSDLDRLGMLIALKAGRSILARCEHPLSRAFIHGVPSAELVAIPVGVGAYLLQPSSEETQRLDEALRRNRDALDAVLGAQAQKTASPTHEGGAETEELPVLNAGGTIRFASHAQFIAQHEINLVNGAIMARGPAIAVGTRRRLVIAIPQAAPLEVLDAEVVFQEGQFVGFSVPNLELFRAELESRLVPDASQTQSPTRREGSRVAKPPFSHSGRLSGLPDVRGFTALRTGDVNDLSEARGWYVGILDRVLRSGRDAVTTLEGESGLLRVWVFDRRVVAVERPQAPAKDRLGERLLSARILDPTSLTRALESAEGSPKPIGQVILEIGAATRADVHRALRRQTLDRLIAPCDWEEGRIEVGAWSDPAGDADLLPVSGEAVVTALLRRQLQHTRMAALRDEFQPMFGRTASVDLAAISEAYRLTEREQRFYQRGAEAHGTLANMLSLIQSRPLEGYRLALMGMALGFISLKAPRSGG